MTRIVNAAKTSISAVASAAAKTSAAAKAAAKAKSPARSKVSDIGATAESAASKNRRPAAAAKRSKSGAIKREEAGGSIGSRADAVARDVTSSARPAAKKQAADGALDQAVSVSTPEGIDLIEASKRQAIGDAAAPARAAASVNSIPTEEEQSRVTKKIEKKTSAEFPAIVRRGSDSAVAEAIVTARAAAVREAAALVVETAQSEARSGDKATMAIAKPVKSSTAPRQGFKPKRFHRLSGARRRPDRRDRGAGSRRLHA